MYHHHSNTHNKYGHIPSNQVDIPLFLLTGSSKWATGGIRIPQGFRVKQGARDTQHSLMVFGVNGVELCTHAPLVHFQSHWTGAGQQMRHHGCVVVVGSRVSNGLRTLQPPALQLHLYFSL